MSLTNGAVGAYKYTTDVKNAIDTYNKYCNDYNNSRTYGNDAKAALLGSRLLEAAGLLEKLKVPLTGDPADFIKKVSDLSTENQLRNMGITDPEVRRLLELDPPKPIDNGTCLTADYPIPPSPVSQDSYDKIKDLVRDAWDRAKNFILRRDPLTFDLDGDGLETVGLSNTNPILFDHDGDGIKNGTGWVKSDDAFLILDKNGNGTIDSGLELFGDSTVKSNGQKATDGFDALADLDSNTDGVVNNQDAQYANLKLWRDLNQDGESQSGELFSLNELGIIGINVASTEHSTTLADTGSYIKADGSIGAMGETLNNTGNLGDINLADNTFHREFADQLDTSTLRHSRNRNAMMWNPVTLKQSTTKQSHWIAGQARNDGWGAANDNEWRNAA